MKVLVGIVDPAPDGFHWTQQGEILKLGWLICRSCRCGCDRSWSGTSTSKASTLARVTETPPCFNLKPDLAVSQLVMAAVRIAEQYPVGTLLRARYSRERGPGPQDLVCDDIAAFIAAWDITVAGGPN